MKYIEGQPIVFAEEKEFIEHFGDAVWEEFCDAFPIGEVITVEEAAPQLNCLCYYKDPQIYLNAVLKNVIGDYNSRPEAYEGRPPVQQRGENMTQVML
jgi:hypothetical protein